MSASQPFDSWLFYGGTLSLDFVNTLRDRAATPRETLTSPESLALWLARAELIASPGSSSAAEDDALRSIYEEALELREAVDAVLSQGTNAEPEQVLLVNRWALSAQRPQLAETPPVRLLERPKAPREALGAIAVDAIAIIARDEQKRVKVCAHDRCGMRYLDRSRTGQRRWCSMQRCGNRTKVARHTANKASATPG